MREAQKHFHNKKRIGNTIEMPAVLNITRRIFGVFFHGDYRMRKLILASASVLALGIAGSGIGYAAEPTSSSTNLPASSAQTQNTQAQTAPVKASESEIKQAQEQLKKASLYKGTADGKMGPEMKQALSDFQQQHKLKQTGMLDQETLAALNNNQNGAASSLSGSTTRPSTSSGTIAPTKSQ